MYLLLNKCMASKTVESCDRVMFEAFLGSKTLSGNLSEYRRLLADMKSCGGEELKVLEDRKREMKGNLFPMFLPQCREFKNNLRAKENAVEGYIVTGDYDHCGIDLAAHINSLRERIDFREEGIVFAEVSVGGDGLHVWALAREGETVVGAQERLERLVGLKRDEHMNRMYQGSLLSGEVLYYDAELMWSDEGKFAFVPSCEEPFAVDAACAMADVVPAADGEELFRGAPLRAIVENLMDLTGGRPVYGERHSRYYDMALKLRNICDYNAERLYSVMEIAFADYDEIGDKRRVCADVCKDKPHKKMPNKLSKAIEMARAEHLVEKVADENTPLPPLPDSLPRVFRFFISKHPAEYAPALIMVLLTLFGFLATRVRCCYNRGTEIHPLTFLTFISAPFATGKSFVRNIVNVVLGKVIAESKRLVNEENAWKKKSQSGKSAKKKGANEPEPKFRIRYISPQISNTEFLNRLSNAEGEHLFFFEEEFGSMVKAARRGPAYELWDTFRLAFDGAEMKQNFYSVDSISGIEKVMLNFVICGTPKLLSKELNKHVEDGLASRLIVADIPQVLGGEQPVFKKMSNGEIAEVEKVCDMLSELDETVTLKKVDTALREWTKCQGEIAVRTFNNARFSLMKRSAIIGYRASVIAYLLSNRKESKALVDFAIYVAEYVFRKQMDMFGETVNNECGDIVGVHSGDFDYYAALPDLFTCSDLRNLRVDNNESSNISGMIKTWKKRGMIEDTNVAKQYHKICNSNIA